MFAVEWGGVEWVGLNPILVSALAPFGLVEVGLKLGPSWTINRGTEEPGSQIIFHLLFAR